MTFSYWDIFGFLVFILGLLDAIKYKILVKKVKRYKSSRGQSRTFTNIALFHKLVLSIWATFYLKDLVVALSSIVALYTSCELWWAIYLHYPYKHRGLNNFKRPSVIKFFINSFYPNRKKYRL